MRLRQVEWTRLLGGREGGHWAALEGQWSSIAAFAVAVAVAVAALALCSLLLAGKGKIFDMNLWILSVGLGLGFWEWSAWLDCFNLLELQLQSNSRARLQPLSSCLVWSLESLCCAMDFGGFLDLVRNGKGQTQTDRSKFLIKEDRQTDEEGT